MTNFDYQIQTATDRLLGAQANSEQVLADLSAAQANTAELLNIAKGIGVTAVSVGMVHPRVENEHWSFSASRSIFTPPSEEYNDWPAAWYLTKAAGISGTCGNRGQHEADTSGLVDGVYELRDGNWARIDNEDATA